MRGPWAKKILTATLTIACVAFCLVPQSLAVPGDSDDPLVSKSWVEGAVDAEFGKLESRLQALQEAVSQIGARTEIVLTIGSKIAYINGEAKTMETAPLIKNSSTMLPLRLVGEAIGVSFKWDDAGKTVTFSDGQKSLSLKIGAKTAQLGTEQLTLDNPAVIVNGRTMAPVRFVAEAFACKVDWIAADKKVVISK